MSRKSSGNTDRQFGSLWGHRDFGSLAKARHDWDVLKRCFKCQQKFTPELLIEFHKQYYCKYCIKAVKLGGSQ